MDVENINKAGKGETCCCPYCDQELFIDAPFCVPCGKKILFCPECGEPLPQSAERCDSCGAEIEK